jgi:FkbM family methyltransferase
MKKNIKSMIKKVINWTVIAMSNNFIGRYIYSQILASVMDRRQNIEHMGLELMFTTPNELNQYRADSFSSKEPETLEWIDKIPEYSVFWDIGANVGLYSCYAAKKIKCNVFAFEPSVFNLELLARNIFINNLTDKITIIPLPLSETLAVNKLNMTTTEWGGALSTFGESFGYDGQSMSKVFEFSVIGLSMCDAIESLKIPQPDFIKMDVDGIEHLILKGGMPILEKVREILIEINDSFSTQANEASKLLQQAGFELKEKRHAEEFDTGMGKDTFNQIWVKKV